MNQVPSSPDYFSVSPKLQSNVDNFRTALGLTVLTSLMIFTFSYSSSFFDGITSRIPIFIPFFSTEHVSSTQSETNLNESYEWLAHLCRNVFSYLALFGGMWGIGYVLKAVGYFDKPTGQNENIIDHFLRIFFVGYPLVEKRKDTTPIQTPPIPHSGGLQLCMCTSGLLLSYLAWGVLQERVMTVDYDGERFTDSQFLVFANRTLGCVLALGVVLLWHWWRPSSHINQASHRASFLDYGYSAVSNILSSWCQYEALKFLSFPTQVLGKACKMIPVMLMGRLVTRRTYKPREYVTAGLLSLGMGLFLLSTGPSESSQTLSTTSIGSTTSHSAWQIASGIVLLAGYLLFDAFNSNWQDRLFKERQVSSLQMMAYTNLWSSLLTVATLVERASLQAAWDFSRVHSTFLRDVMLLSLCGAVGQLFIFVTIARFGAVTFVLIMTLRQALAVLLSCALYQHPLSPWALLGLAVVFGALLARAFSLNSPVKLKTEEK